MFESPSDPLPAQIARTRAIAKLALGRFATLDGDLTRESILLSKGRFCGIRFTLGSFNVRWQPEDRELAVYRERQILAQIPLEADTERRAA